MNDQRKEIIVSKRLIPFYKECYEKYGYRVEAEWRNKHHLSYTLLLYRLDDAAIMNEQNNQLCQMESRLRLIEVIEQKKRRFLTLFFNLFIHAALFSFQAVLFVWLKLSAAHPTVMLQAGILSMQVILLGGFGIKLWECLRWNRIQHMLKRKILEMEAETAGYSEENIQYISVLFTRSTGVISALIYWLTGRQYTHVSLGLGTQTECFYSFRFKGFSAEHPGHRKLRHGKKESLCYQFRVTSQDYTQLEATIRQYQQEKDQRRYNLAGTFFCALRIYMPLKNRDHYFCSEFVSEQLQKMEGFKLRKSARMYLPTSLAKALIQQSNLYRVLVNEV